MGACSIGFSVEGDRTQADVVAAFHRQQELDHENWLCDHDSDEEESYTGDFQTVSRVRFVGKEFDNHDDANDYCLDHAEKWVDVIAVKVKNDTEHYWWVAGWGAE